MNELLQTHAEEVLKKSVQVISIVPCMIKQRAYWEKMREIEKEVRAFKGIEEIKGEDIDEVVDWAKQQFMTRSNISQIIP